MIRADRFTDRSKRVLELAFREALLLGHAHIGTEHILLALIREGDGVAGQVLADIGAEDVRKAVLKKLMKSIPRSSVEERLAHLEETVFSEKVTEWDSGAG